MILEADDAVEIILKSAQKEYLFLMQLIELVQKAWFQEEIYRLLIHLQWMVMQ